MTKLFLTGGTGFLGAHLRARLRASGTGMAVAELPRAAGADLLDAASYARELEGADTVVHLAAATGKALPAEHQRVNVRGTEVLVEQSRRLGVRRFVFVSSIAAKFPDVRRYAYAQAKQAAEAVVADSGLDFTIVRPTIIAGRGSPVLAGLRWLAGLPVVPVFGTGKPRVQPILVDDLADCLVSVIREGLGSRQAIELGGPEVVTIERLLGEMHRILTAKPMRTVRVPLGPLLPMLTLLETVAYRLLPITVGQLATFRFDGVAAPNPVFERHRAGMTGLTRMLELSLAA